MHSRFAILIALLLLARAAGAATPMDITTLTPGPAGTGSFTGTLGGVGVTGTLSVGAGTSFNAVGPGIGGSNIASDSPQWSYGTVYTPAFALSDRVGFSKLAGGGTALVTVSFASPMTDLVFDIANLDWSSMDFGPSIADGLTGVSLLSGNGAAGDGLGLSGTAIVDLPPPTSDATPPFSPPPLAGPRSAYGSVLLSGTYGTLDFVMFTGPLSDDANFTFVSVPEPTGIVAGLCCLGMATARRRRR